MGCHGFDPMQIKGWLKEAKLRIARYRDISVDNVELKLNFDNLKKDSKGLYDFRDIMFEYEIYHEKGIEESCTTSLWHLRKGIFPKPDEMENVPSIRSNGERIVQRFPKLVSQFTNRYRQNVALEKVFREYNLSGAQLADIIKDMHGNDSLAVAPKNIKVLGAYTKDISRKGGYETKNIMIAYKAATRDGKEGIGCVPLEEICVEFSRRKSG